MRETVKAIPSSASGVSGFEVEVGVGVGDDVTSVSSVRWIISKNFFFFFLAKKSFGSYNK